MNRRTLAMAVLLLSLPAYACLGTLPRDDDARAIVLSPNAIMDLPLHEQRPYWMLRAEPGWRGAWEVRYGGEPEDPALASFRALMFDSTSDAARAFGRLTPEHLFLLLRDRMRTPPRPFVYPEPLPGDEVFVTLYLLKVPVEDPDQNPIYGQLTVIRVGRILLVSESIGIHPEKLVPTLTQLVAAAHASQ